MRKFTVQLSLAALMLGSVATTAMVAAAAAPKIGSICSNAGAFFDTPTKRFVCKKEGEKKVWRVWSAPKQKTSGTTPTLTPKPIPTPKPTSTPKPTPTPTTFVTPHPVDNKYGITWQNITSRVKDISAAAYTDAQATIARNQGLPSAADVFTTYISPGATQLYPQAENGPNLMKRTFSLFAKYPHAKQVFYVATTLEEKAQTFAKLDVIYPKSPFMKNSINDMDGTNTNQPQGSVFVQSTCKGNSTARNTRFWEQNTISASAVVFNFCPTNNPRSRIESDHGAAHEYVHTLVTQMYSEKQLGLQPCWMKEGEAEWSQTAVSSDFSEYIAMQHFHPYYQTFFGLEFSQPTQTTWTVSEIDSYLKAAIVMPCHLTPQYSLAYSAGAAAIEALVAIAGSESFFAVDQRIASGMNFVDAFKEIYGVTWDYAEPILADVVAQKLTLAQSKDALTYQTRP